ncbi:hypothetical protein [Corallincola spongiicola]|uniref:DUF4382 domain-containing protein n=1 Tax=Corallincola spongiicola TaxID=2520508 RepID=A0ABY1WLW5_9GAMM|nr:hypothetical protein [Corallincola spongiicola]TAA42579.1 hypothetical protein EXY25_14905 [Corallincola spongiicola]
MKVLRLNGVIIFALMMLQGCGGGGGDSGDDNTTPIPETAEKTFTVKLINIDATQVSNGEAIELETDMISSTGTVMVSQ